MTPYVLKSIRKSALARSRDNDYTWISPEHVLAMVDEIERLRFDLAQVEKLSDPAAKAAHAAIVRALEGDDPNNEI